MDRRGRGSKRGRHLFAAAVTAGFLLSASIVAGLVPGVAGAQERPPVTLTSTSQTASWSGEFVAGALGPLPVVALPEACTPQLCDIVPLDVQLPEKTWRHRPGGMLVAIQAPLVDLFAYDVDLFIYAPDGLLAASSSGFGFANEAAWVPNPVNGNYRVVVVPRFVLSQPLVDEALEPLRYDGFVRFDRGVTVQRKELNFGLPMTREFVAFGLTDERPPVELLPDLVPTTPRNFHIETTAGVPPLLYAARGPRHQPSCYPEETLQLTDHDPDIDGGPERCLRFDQGEYNFGDGPFQLNIYRSEDESEDFEVHQRIYSSDGDVRSIGPLGEVEFHEDHGHFHYKGFQQVTLHRIEEDGTLTFVKKKRDKGICPGDAEMGWFGRTDRSTSPLAYISNASFGLFSLGLSEDQLVEINSEDQQTICVADSHQDPNDDAEFRDRSFIEMGISVGWADVYPWFIADQYIDISDVLDGDYALVVRQDVDKRVLEKSTENNTAIGCVNISGDVAQEISCRARGARMDR